MFTDTVSYMFDSAHTNTTLALATQSTEGKLRERGQAMQKSKADSGHEGSAESSVFARTQASPRQNCPLKESNAEAKTNLPDVDKRKL